MKAINFILFALVGIYLSGCATVSVSSDYDQKAQFSGLKTYSWAGPHPVTGNPRLDSDILHDRIKTAVDNELARKGFQKIDQGNPDFKVAYHVGLEQKVDVSSIPSYDYNYPSYYGDHGFDRHVGYETDVYHYEEGSILLDIIDPNTKNLIWRGTAKAEVYPMLPPQKKEERVNEAIQKILSQFPPTK